MDDQKKENSFTMAELYENKDLTINQEKLLVILNSEPKKEWVKEHPFIKGYKYLPIDKIEFLLKKIFKSYRIEVIKTSTLFNSIECVVRVHYLDPVAGWTYQDGVGACELQTQKDSGCLKPDFSNINKGAVTMALPIAKTIAIKDACDMIGNIFGANLNRRDVLTYNFDNKILN